MKFKISALLTAASNLLLPDSCALCGTSLCIERAEAAGGIPLCISCRAAADAALIDRFWPSGRCSVCGYPLTSETEKCVPCRAKEWNFNSCASLFLYEDTGKELICAYKFGNRRGLARYFAELILEYHRKCSPDSIIVPVPFRAASKRKRGWDQIEQITDEIIKISAAVIIPCLRRNNGPAQKTMDYQNRLNNLRGKIHLKQGINVPEKVLLLDDVFTTGATMDYCAQVLKKAGTEEINALSIALDL